MSNIALLAACLLIGLTLRWSGRLPDNAHLSINGFVVHVSLPALILSQIHGLCLTVALLLPVSMPWVLFAFAASAFTLLGRRLRLPAAATGALIMTGGLANTSFVGLPMIETFYGREHLSIGILIDQLGSYLVLSTLGIAVACVCSARAATPAGVILRRVLTFPPLIALILAVATSPLPYPGWLGGMLHRLGDTLAPLALVSVGLQLRLAHFRGNVAALGCGLSFKLLLAPAVIAAIYVGLLDWREDTARVTVFEAAMGPMIGGGIVAMQYGLSPSLVTLMLGAGIALSFLTLPLWYLGLGLVP